MAATTNPEHVNRETTFELLSSSERREIIVTLYESGSVERDSLAKTLAAGESDADEDARRRTRISLHHNHLPRLAEAGLVVYDDETVTPTNRLRAVASKIARFDEEEEVPVRA
jgi:hypothetical protein